MDEAKLNYVTIATILCRAPLAKNSIVGFFEQSRYCVKLNNQFNISNFI
jgi:hypothetical protein